MTNLVVSGGRCSVNVILGNQQHRVNLIRHRDLVFLSDVEGEYKSKWVMYWFVECQSLFDKPHFAHCCSSLTLVCYEGIGFVYVFFLSRPVCQNRNLETPILEFQITQSVFPDNQYWELLQIFKTLRSISYKSCGKPSETVHGVLEISMKCMF